MIRIAIVIAVDEVRSDLSQVACADRPLAHHAGSLWARCSAIHQYEFHVAPPNAALFCLLWPSRVVVDACPLLTVTGVVCRRNTVVTVEFVAVALSVFGRACGHFVTCNRLFRSGARLGGLEWSAQSYVGKRAI